jgi:hypothetical protein
MRIILIVGILFLSLGNILAQKTITCKVDANTRSACEFSGVTLGEIEAFSVTVETSPANADVNAITLVRFTDSSIYSVPSEVFTKFPKVKEFSAVGQKVQEIKSDTFKDGKNLEEINLGNNELVFMYSNTFEGKNLGS